MVRLVRRALVPAGLAVAVAAEWRSFDWGDAELVVADGVVGMVLVVCGVVAWERKEQSRTGPLMVLAGVTWFAGTFASVALFWHRGPLVHLLLSYPTGRLRRRLATATVVVAYVDAVVVWIARNDVVTVALAVLVAVAAVDVFAATSGPARKAGRAALAATLAYAGILAGGALQRLVASDQVQTVQIVYDIVIGATAIVLTVDLLRGRWRQATVADLVVALSEPGNRGTLRDNLAWALGDPSLVVGYWIDERAGYVDDLGRTVNFTVSGADRTITQVDDAGRRVAVLVYDAAIGDDSQLIASVAAAARLAVTNFRLQAEARERLGELAASRRRIVESADEQRRRLVEDLSHGAERRLDNVAQLLERGERGATDEETQSLGELGTELRGARDELRDLAHGIRPVALGAGGLAAALPILVARTPVPVTVAVEVGRLPPAVEAAVFFVCAEALTNISKHALASAASVTVGHGRGSVVARIVDDGVGCVDLRRGTGLRGLADRVEALGGWFVVETPASGGTIVMAEVPINETGGPPDVTAAGSTA